MLSPGEHHKTRVLGGKGVELTLEDGRVVLDAGSLSSCLVGHCHPKLVEAIDRAARSVYVNDSTGYGPREAAAKDLLNLAFADEDWAEAVVFAVSASEAVDLGLLLSQVLTGRAPLVRRELAYHGAVGLARSASSHPYWSAALAGDGEAEVPSSDVEARTLPVPRCGTGTTTESHRCTQTCLATSERQLTGAAAVIMDCSQGAVLPSPQYQDELARLARGAGALWVADETVTGLGRLGRGFAFQRGASRPDIVAMGKGLTGGAVPGGALVLSRDVVESVGSRRWLTASTYRGHPLTVAALSATLRILDDEDLVARSRGAGERIAPDMRSLSSRHAVVSRVVGEGLMWMIELVGPPSLVERSWFHASGMPVPADFVHRAALDLGVFVGVYSPYCVWIVPPLVIGDKELGRAVEVLDQALSFADVALAEVNEGWMDARRTENERAR